MRPSLGRLTLEDMRKRLLGALILGAFLVPPGVGRARAFAKSSEVESAFAASAPRERAAGPAEYPVIVIAIDGVRPQEIFEGEEPSRVRKRLPKSAKELTPNLHAVGAEGRILGRDERVTASGPNYVSLPGYTEMFSGARAVHCKTNDCGRTQVPTVVDALVDRGQRAVVVSSWDRICLAAAMDEKKLDGSCGRHHGELDPEGDGTLEALVENARSLGPGAGHDDYRPDFATAEIALRVLETKRPDFLFVGLGDTDEHAHAGNYEGYVAALTQADAFVGDVRARLGWLGERGQKTTILVVTDHGRAKNFRDHGGASPESRFGFMAVFGPTIERGAGPGADLSLGDVGRGAAKLLELPGDSTPFTRWLSARK